MADRYIDDEASEVSDASSDGEEVRRDKKTKSRREIVDSSEEEDEDDDEAEEEMKDLINDEEEEDDEDDESSADEEGGAKRSHDDDESSSLEEDDLELIQENTGVRVNRKKFKRVRRIDDDDSEEEDEGKRIQNELFGADLLGSDDEDVQKQRSGPQEQDLDLGVDDEEEESDPDDFIVDDHDQPVARKAKKKGARHSDAAMRQAQEIFGVDFDYDDVEGDYDDADEGGYDDDYDEDEEGERPRRRREGRKTIYDVYEPSELERSHLTARDQEIRTKDEPERFQLRSVRVTEATDEEIEEEADWIYNNAFSQNTISLQERDREPIAGKRFELIKPEIMYALRCIRNEKLEVPYIAAYRREYIDTISSSFDDTRDLWTIYKFDIQWCRLQASKRNISKLYDDMSKYLDSKPGDQKIRKISEQDLDRVKNAKNFYDIEDCRIHFKLYYAQLITEMKLFTLEKTIAEQREERENRIRQKKNRVQSGEAELNENTETDDNTEKNLEEAEDDQEEDESGETEEEKLFKRLSKFKISSGRDRYQAAREHEIGGFVSKFGLTPEQFGENLREDYQVNNVAHHNTKPLDEAAKFIKSGTRFSSREEVLEAGKLMYSKEVSCEPLVRQTIRRYYFENAVINVKPTASGFKEIDENHPCYLFKFLKNKPVNTLANDQILHLINAERDKLLEVKFSIEALADSKGQISPYHESLKALFYSDFSSINTKEWNELREEAIKVAVDKHILPCLEKQLREKLVKEAQDKIIKDSCEKLHNWLNIAPYSPAQNFDEYEGFELRNGTRICGFTFDPEGEAPCFSSIVGSEGELMEHVRLPFLNIRKRPDRMNHLEKENHAKDRIKFKQFIIDKKPHVVALAAETIQTKYICQHLAQILDELHQNDGLPLIPIEIVDNELSNVYMNLKKANEEFPEFPALLLQAVSNARKLNDPLVEYAKLCNSDNDILCIRFHPLQDELPKEEFLDNLYQQFITRTNAVGVDPNRVLAQPHTTELMQFIAGLGPRKGAHLLRLIKKSSTGQLVSRQQLIRELGMTQVIFVNCSGFIKLDTEYLMESHPDETITHLDSTRIHPQAYVLAKKIAVDANSDGDEDEDVSDDAASNAIEAILEHPERLDDLDLNAFAKELMERQEMGKKGYTLQGIREEFQCRYKDYREPYRQPTQHEIFDMLTKETAQTFYNGKLITCQVSAIPRKKPVPTELDMANPVKIDETNLWRCPFCKRSDFMDLSVVWNHFDTDDCPGYAIGVKCKLDNGLFGFIPLKFFSDREVSDPAERVMIGQTIHARVMKIDPEKFSCELTCRTSDLLDEMNKLRPMKDDYYDFDSEKRSKQELAAKSKRQTRSKYCKRVITHPAFENIDCKACEKKLLQMEQGHAIIRPSSQGQNYLTLSWKVTDNICQHVTIREEDKENPFSLGHQLFIEEEPYEDLDEIIARYVQPMASYARELLNYKHCIKLNDGIDEIELMQGTLSTAKKLSASLPYRFCPSKRYPGRFLLGYQPKDRAKIEYLTVTPRGYRFRKTPFRNLLLLIKWFKDNWNWTSNMNMSIHGSVPMSQ